MKRKLWFGVAGLLPVLALALSSCGAVKTPKSEAGAEQSGSAGLVAPTTWEFETQHESFGQTIFDPPPADTKPAHTFLEAFNLCLAADNTQAKCGSGAPTVKLALFSDNTHGDVQPDGSVKLSYRNLLVWWMRWGNQSCGDVGGLGVTTDGKPLEPTVNPSDNPHVCRLDSIVDATTNTFLEAYRF